MTETSAEAPQRDPIDSLYDCATTPARCAAVTQAVDDGRSGWYRLDRSRFDTALALLRDAAVAELAQTLPPSVWRQLQAGGSDRLAEWSALLAGRDNHHATRARVDLAVLCALLGADPGARWRYTERPGGIDALALPVQRQQGDALLAMLDQATGKAGADAPEPAPAPAPSTGGPSHNGTTGLVVATFRAFCAGVFSSDPADALRADALALKRLDAAALRAAFQAGPSNPLAGLEARASLLQRLGEQLQSAAGNDARSPARPADIVFDARTADPTQPIDLPTLLQRLLRAWGPIWPAGARVLARPAGDTWPHAWAGGGTGGADNPHSAGQVPFHQRMRWLAQSLADPLRLAGRTVEGLDSVATAASLHAAGFFIDTGIVVAREPRDLAQPRKPGHELVVEWRALAVTLADELGAELNRSWTGAPLSRPQLLQALADAGERLARERRDGALPLMLDLDGAMF